jgi:hypothetical protein
MIEEKSAKKKETRTCRFEKFTVRNIAKNKKVCSRENTKNVAK